MLTRRHFFTGLVAAPAIIKLAPLMRISPIPQMFLSPSLVEEIYRWQVLSQAELSYSFTQMKEIYAANLLNEYFRLVPARPACEV